MRRSQPSRCDADAGPPADSPQERDFELAQLRAQLAAATAAACEAYEDNARLVRVLTVLGQPYEPEEMSVQALTVLSQTFDAAVTCLARRVDDRLIVISACGLPDGDPAYAGGWPIGPAAISALRSVAAVSRDATQFDDADVPPALASLEIRAAAWVPLSADAGTHNGLLALYRRGAARFTPAEVQVLGSVAFRLSVALSARQRSVRAERLARSGHRLSRHLDLPSLYDEAASLLRDLVAADSAGILTIVDDEAVVSAHQGSDAATCHCESARQLPGWDTIAEGQAYRCSAGTRFDAGARPARAALYVPVMREGTPAAVLYALRERPRPFLDDDVGAATTLAYYLRSAMINAELYLALRENESTLRLITDSVSDLIAVVDPQGRFSYASPSHERELARAPTSLCGSRLLDLVHPEEYTVLQLALEDPSRSPKVEYRIRTGSGGWVWVESALHPAASSDRSVVLSSRVIEERRRLEDELRLQATHDPLTGLANRVLVAQRLNSALDTSDGMLVGLLFCDLDKFKAINDRLGHEFGDELLVLVAERLRRCLRAGDLLARLGGDEFVFVLEHVYEPETIGEVGHRVVAAMASPFVLEGESVVVSASVGGVYGKPGQATASAMMRNADAAMYAAKRRGPGLVEIFDEEDAHRSLDRLEIRSDLQFALERDQLVVYYQPVVDMDRGEIVTFEALLRWRHPERGLVSPEVFIPLAEETGAIVPIGRWVLDQAVRQLHGWQRRFGARGLGIHVNVSAVQLHRAELAAELVEVVRSAGVDPADVWLEVTEHGAIQSDATNAIIALSEAGLRLCLDDFGISHSNLEYLTRLPVDCLKIDRSFVAGITGDHERRGVNRGIIRAVLAIADSLDLKVVAEGIETDEQRDLLRRLGCRWGQGFRFARPLPAHDATELLRAGRPVW